MQRNLFSFAQVYHIIIDLAFPYITNNVLPNIYRLTVNKPDEHI